MISSLPLLILLLIHTSSTHSFTFQEATITTIHHAFHTQNLTSVHLVNYYLNQIHSLNPHLHAVIEVNPDAIRQAKKADYERRSGRCFGGLHGIPVLLKDNIATRDRLNTTAGSFALLGSVVPRDAGVVRRLRNAGAVILGKTSLTEWANFRSNNMPSGWSARGGQGRNPYSLSAGDTDPCGSSSGSAIAAAANMAVVTLGTETDGSIICPAAVNSVVGIKPTVGLTSRSGVIPISPRQDTVGPICRTVSDAVEVLDVIVGYDHRDVATKTASMYIPLNGYKQFLNLDGLKGKRVGVLKGFFDYPDRSAQQVIFKKHFNTLRNKGAVLIDNLEIANLSTILGSGSGEGFALLTEFKMALNSYLTELSYTPVRSLADVIAFNNKHKVMERIEEYGQPLFLEAEGTKGIGTEYKDALAKMKLLSVERIEKLMRNKKLDAILTPDASASSLHAIGGYPAITVPAGYDHLGLPFGLCFGGLKGFEPKLIEIAYAFEQATSARRPLF